MGIRIVDGRMVLAFFNGGEPSPPGEASDEPKKATVPGRSMHAKRRKERSGLPVRSRTR